MLARLDPDPKEELFPAREDTLDCVDCRTVDEVEDDWSSVDEKLVYEGSCRTDELRLSDSLTVDNLEPDPPKVTPCARLNTSSNIFSSSSVI